MWIHCPQALQQVTHMFRGEKGINIHESLNNILYSDDEFTFGNKVFNILAKFQGNYLKLLSAIHQPVPWFPF